MKNLLFGISLVLLFISCSKSDEKEKSSEETKVETKEVIKRDPGTLVNLKYNFKKGEKFSYKLQTISENSEEIIADTNLTSNIKQNATYTIAFTVKNVTEDNVTELEARINKIVAETNFNGQAMKYDSKFIYSTREKAQFVDYEAIKKVPFSVFVNEIGQVVRVDNINRIMRNILQIQNVPDTLSAKTKEQMKLNISNGSLMPLTQQVFKVVSEDEVGRDSTWQMKYTTPLGVFQVENTAIFTVDEVNVAEADTVVNISSALSINWSGQNQVSENGITYNFADPILSGTGEVIFNHSRGLVESSKSVINLEMAMTANGMNNQGVAMQNTKRDKSVNTHIVTLIK